MKTLKMFCAVIILMITSTSPISAQSGGVYDLSWNVVASGGTTAGGAYEMSIAVGQADTTTLSGGSYSIGGGFWGGGSNPLLPGLYLPLIRR